MGMLINVALDQQEWNAVISILARATWQEANPLIVKIGAALRDGVAVPQGSPRGLNDLDEAIRRPNEANSRQRPT